MLTRRSRRPMPTRSVRRAVPCRSASRASRRIAASSSAAGDGAFELASIRPSRPTRKVHGSRLQAPLSHPAVVAACRSVLLEDLDVDEADAAAATCDARSRRRRRPAPRVRLRAEARGREGDDKRLVGGQRGSDRVTEARSRSGGTRVVSCETAPWVLASVGVAEAGAFAPTATESERALTSSVPSAWIFAPIGSATEPVAAGAVNAGAARRRSGRPLLAASPAPGGPIGSAASRSRSANGRPDCEPASQTSCPAAFDRPRVVVDDEEREADVTDREVRVAGDDGHVLARPLHQRPQRAGSTSSAWRPAIRPAAWPRRPRRGRPRGRRARTRV